MIDELLGDSAGQTITCLSLGNCYLDIPELRDFDEAEKWFQRSHDLASSGDRGKSLGQLGLVAYERFLEGRKATGPKEELAVHLTKAAQLYERALEVIPATDITNRGIVHNQLGNIYGDAGDIDRAIYHYQQNIRYCEESGDVFRAGGTRFNMATILSRANRLHDALAYGEAALANLQIFGDRAAADNIQKVKRLIAAIRQAQQSNKV